MTTNEKCARCNDYIRDCICEECLSCHELVGAGELDEDGNCEDCADEQVGCKHEDVTRYYSRFGATTWKCETCGAETIETDVDEDEDGRGKRETPDWS
jgi:hypothetical protein